MCDPQTRSGYLIAAAARLLPPLSYCTAAADANPHHALTPSPRLQLKLLNKENENHGKSQSSFKNYGFEQKNPKCVDELHKPNYLGKTQRMAAVYVATSHVYGYNTRLLVCDWYKHNKLNV